MDNRYAFQEDVITEMLESENKKIVLGAAPRAGKTKTTLRYLDLIIKKNPTHKHFIFTEGQTFLRSQWMESIKELELENKISFKYKEINSGYAGDFSEADVFVLIPHFLTAVTGELRSSRLNMMRKLDLGHGIVDEAHNWVFSQTYRDVILNLNWKKELYLTGTPFKFNNVNQETPGEYHIIYIPGMLLIDRGIYAETKFDLCPSSLTFQSSDYNTNSSGFSELSANTKINKTELDRTLDSIYAKIGKKRFDSAEKIMILASSISMANKVSQYFSERDVANLVSHSENDIESENIKRFKENGIKILVVVGRATLGFDFPRLEILIDLRGSYNPEVVLQYVARVFTKHPENKEKLFIRAVDTNRFEDDVMLMNFTLSLLHENHFRSFTGIRRDMMETDIPTGFVRDVNTLTRRRRGSGTPDLDFIDDFETVDLFEYLTNSNSRLATTNLQSIKKLLGVNNKNHLPFNAWREIVLDNKLNSRSAYRANYKEFGLSAHPERLYEEFIGWNDFNKVIPKVKKQKKTRIVSPPFAEAKKRIKDHGGIKGGPDYQANCKELGLPVNPGKVYKKEFKGMKDYLGLDKVIKGGNAHKTFVSLEEAVAIVKPLNLKGRLEYQDFVRHNKHLNLPSNPKKIYGDTFPGWTIFLSKK